MRSNISLERLQLNRRLTRYRNYAEAALRQAMRSEDPAARQASLAMAVQWKTLAAEIEAVTKELESIASTAGLAISRS